MTPDRISPHILRQIGCDDTDTDALLWVLMQTAIRVAVAIGGAA